MYILPLDMHIICWAYMVYMPYLVGIFVYGAYLAITSEVEIAAGCVLGYIWKKILGL